MMRTSHRIVVGWCALIMIGLVIFDRYIDLVIVSTYLDTEIQLNWMPRDYLQILAGVYFLMVAVTGRLAVVRRQSTPLEAGTQAILDEQG